MRRGDVLILVSLVAFGTVAQARDPWKIGILTPERVSSSDCPNAFLSGMRELGYVQGRDFVALERSDGGKSERLPALASELVNLKVDVITAWTTPATTAAQRATSAIPVVFALVSDPVKSGFAVTTARPGRNLTGLSNFSGLLIPKRLELLKEVAPNTSRVAYLVNSENALSAQNLANVQKAAQSIGLELIKIEWQPSESLESPLTAILKSRASAIMVTPDVYLLQFRQQIADFASKNRIVASFSDRDGVAAGGLMSYGIDGTEVCRRVPAYVDKILKGAKPSDLPIEQPTKFELLVNLKTAKQLGITLPQSILLRADRVIE